jgi:hypothetical protein
LLGAHQVACETGPVPTLASNQMICYPITLVGDSYLGKDPRRRAQAETSRDIARTLQAHINELLRNQIEPTQVYGYHAIADATRVSVTEVRKLCFGLDGGSHGFTGFRHDLGQAECIRLTGTS